MNSKILQELLQRYNEGRATVEEQQFLASYYAHFDRVEGATPDEYAIEKAKIEVLEGIHKIMDTPAHPIRRIRPWMRYAAAIILLLAGAGLWWKLAKPSKFAAQELPPVEIVQEVLPPAGNKAVLTLANGKQVYLDSAASGSLAMQGKTKVLKPQSGQLSYVGGRNAGGQTLYNTLTLPRGSKPITLTLSDGTKVWINAATTLRYPVAFDGSERKVEVDGEAYFEVASETGRPFRVQKGSLTVLVLGTSFNINTYEEEGAPRVTLLTGAVKVNAGSDFKILRPGQQASVGIAGAGAGGASASTGGIVIHDHVDLGETMAWKDGQFRFNRMDMASIMRELSRWYDLDVVFQGEVTEKFVASISRDKPVSKLLEVLAGTGLVHFRVDGKKVIVMP